MSPTFYRTLFLESLASAAFLVVAGVLMRSFL